jgi:hypothetical protein
LPLDTICPGGERALNAAECEAHEVSGSIDAAPRPDEAEDVAATRSGTADALPAAHSKPDNMDSRRMASH